MFEAMVEELEGYPVVFVKVFCTLEEIRKREVVRGIRPIGYAEQLYDVIHQYRGKNFFYDIEFNTTDADTTANAKKLIEFLETNYGGGAALEKNRALTTDF